MSPSCELTAPTKTGKSLLVSFQHGRVLPGKARKIKFKHYKHENDTKAKLLVAETENRSYFSEGPIEDVGLANYIGVLDKTTGKMQLYPAERFELKSYFKRKDSIKDETDSTETWRGKNDALTMEFGAKKKQRAIETRIKHAVEAEDLKPIMKTTADSVNVTTPITASNSQLFLTVNWEAKSLQDVYNLDDIITEEELHCLEDSANTLLNATTANITEWQNEKTFSPFIINQIKKLKESSSLKLAELLLYLHYLHIVFDLRAPELRKKQPLSSDIPQLLQTKMLETYTENCYGPRNSIYRTVSVEKRDKLVAHIIALALFINGFKIDFADLNLKFVRFSAERVITIGRLIGARQNGPKTSKVLELALPLVKFNAFQTRRPAGNKK